MKFLGFICDIFLLFKDNVCFFGFDIWVVFFVKMRIWKEGLVGWYGKIVSLGWEFVMEGFIDYFRSNVFKVNVVEVERYKKRYRLLFKIWMLMLFRERIKNESVYLYVICEMRCESKLLRIIFVFY